MGKCNCAYCRDGRDKRHVNQHGYDGQEELPYRPDKKYKKKHVHVWKRIGYAYPPPPLTDENKWWRRERFLEACENCGNVRTTW